MERTIENYTPASNRAERVKTRAERTGERMAEHISDIAREINQEIKENYGVESFLNTDGSINMETYAARNPVLISEKDLEDDKKTIQDKEKIFTGVINESKRKYFGVETDEEVIEEFKKEKLGDKSKQMEMIALSVLYKVLKEKYIVVHSSVYDDYENGMDNILVDKETGDVICAFDELHNNPRGTRYDEKMEKVIKAAKTGGKTIRYGFTIENKKIAERPMRNLPIFMLSLTDIQLNDAIRDVSLSTKGSPNKEEIKIMHIFIENLRFQLEEIRKNKLPDQISGNLNKFEQFLGRAEEIMAEHNRRNEVKNK
jgi:hypothetical protein